MLRSFVAAGGSVESFWTMTPRTFGLFMSGVSDREEAAQANRAWTAWHIAALMRANRLPNLREMMPKRLRHAPRMSPQALTTAIEATFVALGGDAEALARKKKEQGNGG